jgi:hypothetical protein
MAKGLRLPEAIRGLRMSEMQERFLVTLYAAKQDYVAHAVLHDKIFEGEREDPGSNYYRVTNLAHHVKRVIQRTGWHLEVQQGYGYRLVWNPSTNPDETPDVLDVMRDLQADVQALRADYAMLQEVLTGTLSALVGLPAHYLVPLSTWTPEVDAEILETKGITGKLSAIAERLDVDPSAVVSRFKALRKPR